MLVSIDLYFFVFVTHEANSFQYRIQYHAYLNISTCSFIYRKHIIYFQAGSSKQLNENTSKHPLNAIHNV